MVNKVEIERIKQSSLKIAEIKKLLEKGELKTKSQSTWLIKQRKKYNESPSSYPKELKLLLDNLNPLLGYNWDVGTGMDRESYELRMQKVLTDLKKGKKLSAKQRSQILSKAGKYRSDPNSISKETLEYLDLLIPFLGFDWREKNGYLNVSFSQFVDEIIDTLKSNKPLSKRLKTWLRNKQYIYINDRDRINTTQLNHLKRLEPHLGIKWTEYPKINPEDILPPHIEVLKEALKNNEEIPIRAKDWLHKQRRKYNEKPSAYNLKDKQSLDELIPMLGYDWKFKRLLRVSIENRVKLVKNNIKRDGHINSLDQTWLNGVKYRYEKDSKNFKLSEVKLLESLNPFLKKPWNTTLEDRLSIAFNVKKIKKINLPYEKLENRHKSWIELQRRNFNKNPKGFTKEEIKLLNSLTPILLKKWNVYEKNPFYDTKRNARILLLEDKLKKGEILNTDDFVYLSKKRRQYNDKIFTDKKHIKRLNDLIPLLGFDWKKRRIEDIHFKTFKKNIKEIKKLLRKQLTLTDKLNNIINYNRIQYKKNPDKFPIEKEKLLDSITPLLGRDWKELKYFVKNPIPFEERVELVKNKLKISEDLNGTDIRWLHKNRTDYRKDPKKFDSKRKELLDRLNDYLPYDWKTYFRERDKKVKNIH